jgi:hypothetical protein
MIRSKFSSDNVRITPVPTFIGRLTPLMTGDYQDKIFQGARTSFGELNPGFFSASSKASFADSTLVGMHPTCC